jgi:hypothetical protein
MEPAAAAANEMYSVQSSLAVVIEDLAVPGNIASGSERASPLADYFYLKLPLFAPKNPADSVIQYKAVFCWVAREWRGGVYVPKLDPGLSGNLGLH